MTFDPLFGHEAARKIAASFFFCLSLLKGEAVFNAVLDAMVRAEPTAVTLVAKNRGLAAQIARAIAMREPREESACYGVRGEDVPYLSNAIVRSGRSVVGYTGDDLVDEWLAGGNALDPRLRRDTIAWSDSDALFGKPALCLIGRSDSRLDAGQSPRVAICARYWHLANRFIDRLDARGARIRRIRIQGALETVCLQGLADFVVDVVVTGKTVREAGLIVHEVISTSDLAVLEAP